ncbi:uncharacterized protein LOC129218972 [Uloborus diversus]|uniref:uncharacterized protein LOC129218972 n=1 Tax=Uloborus diversus TaxID=327109 RepID=UPI002409DC6E|nr:uncharacterized protein LOC129218972 [Uloborus diversus]
MAFEDNDSDEYLWSERPRRLEHRFLVLRKLGQGTYGKVQLALNKETNQEVAIKTIKKAKIENDEDMLRIRREIHIMTSIRHPHIIHIYEVFETKQKIVLVMQYASGGELYDYLGCHEKLPEDEARRVFRQISSAIYYCHKNQICHRDLKLENILLDQEGNAQIADFGLSNIFDENRRMSTFCGSALYASPEIVKGMPYKGPEVDCWSLGVLLYTLIYGRMPFDGRNFKELVSQISEGRYEEPVQKSDASNLIRRLLTPEISLRSTILDVCKDDWVNKGYDVSLLEAAESMCSARNFQKEHLLPTKLCQEINAKIDCDRTVIKKSTPQMKQQKTIPLKNCTPLGNPSENGTSDAKNLHLPALYDQILNYDVRFVVNKLISAVEILIITSIVPTVKESIKNDTKQKISLPNGVVQPRDLKKIDTAKNQIRQEKKHVFHGPSLRDEMKNAIFGHEVPKQLTETTVLQSEATNFESIQEHKEICEKEIRNNIKLMYSSSNSKDDFNAKEETNFIQLHELDVPVSRKPSPKPKRRYDNHSHGQKNISPFVRTKNHVLTLARILSSNYEQIVMNSFKKPEKKRKLPGKVTIPANFDSNASRESVAIEREKIVLFPTVSVSENREKIERKIEKIKKAALNMQLKWQYNPKNRLKIEKYLRSQAKKMQDLVCDEQRYLRLSRNNVKLHASFTSFSDICCCFVAKTMNNFITDDHNVSEFCQRPEEQAEESEVAAFNKIKSSAKTGFNLRDIQNIPPNKFKKCQHGYSRTIPSAYLELGNLLRSKSEIKLSGDFLKHVSFHNDDLNSKKQFLDLKSYNFDSEKAKNSTDTYADFANVKSMMLQRSVSDSVIVRIHKAFAINNVVDNQSSTYHNESKFQKLFKQNCTLLQNHVSEKSRLRNEKSRNIQSFNLPDNAQLFDTKQETEIKNLNQCETPKKPSILRARSTSIIADCGEKFCYDLKHYINHLATTPLVNFKENNGMKSLFENTRADDINVSLSSLTRNQTHEKSSENGVQRRNTLCGAMPNNDPHLDDYHLGNEDLESFLWNFYKEQNSLLSKEQNGAQFSSSPNLNPSPKESLRNEDSKSMNNLPSEINMLEKYSIRNFESRLASSTQTLDDIYSSNFGKELNFLRQNTVNNDLSGNLNHTKSMSDGVLTEEERNEILRKFFTENETSHIHLLDPCNNKTASYFSVMLTDLEKKEQLHRTKGNNKSRRYSRRVPNLEKRRKSDHNGKSFLQLLSLKRIEEAEKELERSQKAIVDEIEENPGSLLEALKTYGYKNVISQRFQGSELDSEDAYSMKYPYWLSAKNLKADIPHLQYRYYDASYPQSDTNCLEYEDFNSADNISFSSTPIFNENPHSFHSGVLPNIHNNKFTPRSGKATNSYEFHYNFNGGAMSSPYDFQYDFDEGTSPYFYKTEPSSKQKENKQTFYDWLSANFDEYQSPKKLNPSVFNPEENIYSADISKSCSSMKTERTRSFEDEPLPDFSNRNENMFANNFENYETEKNRTLASDYSEYKKACTVDKCRLTSAISIDDDEREESVQDRIWRKSFYSRFNNSALSRKEKTNFLESDFSSESRANHSYISPKLKNCEKNGFLNSYDLSKATQIKRTPSTKKYSSSIDKLNNSKGKYSKSLFKDEAELSAVNSPFTKIKNNIAREEDSEPEH